MAGVHSAVTTLLCTIGGAAAVDDVRWLAYLRAVYGDSAPADVLLAEVPREAVRFAYHSDKHNLALSPLRSASCVLQLRTRESCADLDAPMRNASCVLPARESCAEHCASARPGTGYRRVQFPRDGSRARKCHGSRDPLRDLGRYGSFYEPCVVPGLSSPDDVLRARRALVLAPDHSWTEVMRVSTSVESPWQEGLSFAWAAHNEAAERRAAAIGGRDSRHALYRLEAPVPFGCWFFTAKGTGVWANVGRSLRADSREHASALLNASAPVLSTDAPRVGNFLLGQDTHWCSRALELGFDSIQVATSHGGGSANFLGRSELVLCSGPCATHANLCGGCPPSGVELRAGLRADRPCVCDPLLPLLNCGRSPAAAARTWCPAKSAIVDLRREADPAAWLLSGSAAAACRWHRAEALAWRAARAVAGGTAYAPPHEPRPHLSSRAPPRASEDAPCCQFFYDAFVFRNYSAQRRGRDRPHR